MTFFPSTRMEVSLGALRHNWSAIRSRVGERRIYAVIKADAYGHGAVALAKTYREAGCRNFAVARMVEAIALRAAGIDEDILILGQEPASSASAVLEYGVTCACAELGFAEALSALALQSGKIAKIHVKIDTGMGRLGFKPEELEKAADVLFGLQGLDVEGIFTHFAAADESRPDYTDMQFARFREALAVLDRKGLSVRVRHACNSAGILAHPDKYLDAVRPGILLYGVNPMPRPDGLDLRPTFAFKSAVVSLHDVEPLSGVGYGLCYMTRGRERIAVIPVGYGDGWTRTLSGKTSVLIRGRRCPILGRICMDQMMADVTDLENVELGDEVVLIGSQGDAQITVQEVAELRGTIPYEIPIALLNRVPRIYV